MSVPGGPSLVSDAAPRVEPWRPTVTGAAAPVAVGAALLCGIAGFASLSGDRSRLWADLLVGGFYFLSLGLAGVLFLAIQYLSRAGWWVVIRRVPEAMAAFVPLGGGLMLALYFGRVELYAWARPVTAAVGTLAESKRTYLSAGPFFVRKLLIVVLWSALALWLRSASRRQEREPGLAAHRRLVRASAVFVVCFAVSFSIASFDWLMSLDPRWYSTIFAVYAFAGLLLSGTAAITLAVVVLSSSGMRRGPLAGVVSASHLHDLGKLLFAFGTFWAYIWVSQYLLIWYSNIPEEVTFYLARTRGGFAAPFFAVLALEWIVPFLALMTRAAKRDPRILAGVSALILAGHWLDLYVLVAPPVLGRVRLGLPEVLLTAGYAGLFLAVAGRAFARTPLLARNDPFLEESLRHHQ